VAAATVLAAITAALLDWSQRTDGQLADTVHTALDTLAAGRA
jgi:hypothetical protein